MSIIEDIYKLNASSSVDVAGDEADISLILEEAPQLLGGSVSGVIYDSVIPPNTVADATVKIFSSAGTPLYHTTSGLLGQYSFTDIPSGTYRLSAVKDGYLMAADINITVSQLIPVVMPIYLSDDPNASSGAVYGIVTDSVADDPLDNVQATLFYEDSGDYHLVSNTLSIADGEYVIEDIPAGTYQIIFTKAGYLSSEAEEVVITSGSNIAVSPALVPDTLSGTGTVSGLISDTDDDPISGAFVGLFTADVSGAAETLVAVTYTNSLGRYMFGGVADGEYIVKAKASETV